MKNSYFLKTGLLVGVLSLAMGGVVFAEETNLEKAETATNKATDATRRVYRDAKDKGCEVINGKMECAGKKAMNKARSLSDEAATKAKEVKNKVD